MNNLFDKNGIWQVDDYYLLDAKNLKKAVKALHKTNPNAIKIGISSESGKIDFSIDFQLITEYFPKITAFWMHCQLHKDTDISPLYALENLQIMQWWSKTPLVVKAFANLQTLSVIYPEMIDFQSDTLIDLSVADAKDLQFLSKIPNLKALTLRDYKGTTLSGIEQVQNIENLTIIGARKLIHLDEIQACKSLRTLTLENTNKNLDITALADSSVCELFLHIAVKNCDFVPKMNHLETLLCKEILSNDLSPLFESKTLKNAQLYKHKKSYSHSKEAFDRRFSW